MSSLSTPNTRSKSKIAANSTDVQKVNSKKSSCKKLLLLDSSSESNNLIEESILQELCNLSPLPSSRKKVQNSDSVVKSFNSLSSPLRSLSLHSPQQTKSTPRSPNNSLNSPRKRVLKENCVVNQVISSVDAKNYVNNKQQDNILYFTNEDILLKNSNFCSPKKKSRTVCEKKNAEEIYNENLCVKKRSELLSFSPMKTTKFDDVSPQKSVIKKLSQKTSKKASKCLENIFTNVKSPSKTDYGNGNSSSLPDPLTAIKSSLHNSIPDHLIGRNIEKKEISEFIENHGKSKISASMYISGAPGTGKSACLSEVLANKKTCQHIETAVFVNCMAFQTAAKVYQRVAKQLGAKGNQAKSFRLASSYIENVLIEKGPMILLVLDEMDQLDSKNQEVLYMMFGWTSLKNSRLLLIGIANSLNLTDRILPRLQAEGRIKPFVINFKPYNKDELLQILQARVQASQSSSNQFRDVFESSALQFCARKVAATTGDARKALDVCRRAIEMIEVKKPSESGIDDMLLPKVNLLQISRVITGVDSSARMSSSDDSSNSDSAFPLQQKLLVCTLVLLIKKLKCKGAPLGKLHESYVKICSKRQVPSVNQSEFFALCELVQSRGVITLKKAKQLRQSQVKLNIQESEIEFALKEKALLSSILQSEL